MSRRHSERNKTYRGPEGTETHEMPQMHKGGVGMGLGGVMEAPTRIGVCRVMHIHKREAVGGRLGALIRGWVDGRQAGMMVVPEEAWAWTCRDPPPHSSRFKGLWGKLLTR
jgi:hypothetical protein